MHVLWTREDPTRCCQPGSLAARVCCTLGRWRGFRLCHGLTQSWWCTAWGCPGIAALWRVTWYIRKANPTMHLSVLYFVSTTLVLTVDIYWHVTMQSRIQDDVPMKVWFIMLVCVCVCVCVFNIVLFLWPVQATAANTQHWPYFTPDLDLLHFSRIGTLLIHWVGTTPPV